MKIRAAGKYFSYIAKFFPVMCASGAFQLMPPATDVARHLDRLDDLSPKGIPKHVARLKKFHSEFVNASLKTNDTREQATAQALALSVSCAIAELDSIRTWEKSPALYLQVAFTGLEQSVFMSCKSERIREKRFIKRLKAIPAFLELASMNIDAITPTDKGLAQTMIRDCARYVTELGETDLGKSGRAPRFLADCLAALREFDRFISVRTEVPENDGPSFELMATTVLGTNRSAKELHGIAKREFNRRTETIAELEQELGRPWREALDAYEGPEVPDANPLDTIIREIHLLRSFIFETAMPSVFEDSPLRVVPQPAHLASTLRPIHHDPALGIEPNESSRCHVSPQIFSGRGFRDDPARLRRIRREYMFMAARQSYPGRHLLDTQRRALGESPLAQVASPLFMDGWYAFAEDLLEELGYLKTPQDRLVLHQRGLARAALGMIDTGLAVGTMDQAQCLNLLKEAGFTTEEGLRHVRIIRLRPARRIMPVLGLHEIRNLREVSELPLGRFCLRLLSNGQIPFAHIRLLMSE